MASLLTDIEGNYVEDEPARNPSLRLLCLCTLRQLVANKVSI